MKDTNGNDRLSKMNRRAEERRLYLKEREKRPAKVRNEELDKRRLLTVEDIESGKSRRGGWNREQMMVLKVPVDGTGNPPSGWIESVVGKDYTEREIQLFVYLRR